MGVFRRCRGPPLSLHPAAGSKDDRVYRSVPEGRGDVRVPEVRVSRWKFDPHQDVSIISESLSRSRRGTWRDPSGSRCPQLIVGETRVVAGSAVAPNIARRGRLHPGRRR